MADSYARSAPISLTPDLKLGAKSLVLTLSAGVGSFPIPDSCTIVGLKPDTSILIRAGLEAPEAIGTKTGAAAETDLKKGITVVPALWTWFQVGPGSGRTMYLKGGASDILEVAVM